MLSLLSLLQHSSLSSLVTSLPIMCHKNKLCCLRLACTMLPKSHTCQTILRKQRCSSCDFGSTVADVNLFTLDPCICLCYSQISASISKHFTKPLWQIHACEAEIPQQETPLQSCSSLSPQSPELLSVPARHVNSGKVLKSYACPALLGPKM